MIEAELYHFQKDLKDGLTISEALQKHGLTFKYVCENLPRAYCSKSKNRGRKSKSRQYILERNGKYQLRKRVNGQQLAFGTFDKLTDAVKVREYCKKHGWKKECIPEYRRRCGVE